MTGNKEELIPIKENHIGIYTCGPTVHDHAHIGNFRTFIFEDLLCRQLRSSGYNVHHVMNITDIDDKIIHKANDKGLTIEQYTAPYIKSFLEDLDILNIIKADEYPKATDHVEDMLILIEKLIISGHAYISPSGDISFCINKFPAYGNLVGDGREYTSEDDFVL